MISWYEFGLMNLEELPASRLPILLQDKLGVLFAVWYDSTEASDRILLGIQEYTTRGKGSIIDDLSERQNSFPVGCVGPDNMIYVAWCSEGEDGTQIYLAAGDGITFTAGIMCSDGENLYYSSPQVMIDSNLTAQVVWYSDTLKGGNGAIYFDSVKVE
jgi:hypothetical protein